MTAVDYTSTVLYHYLRALSVRVSRATVRRLLDTPVAGSMRSLSDALDALHVKNEVYQLPPSPDYFGQLEAPFVTMLQVESDPYCVVTGRDDTTVTFIDGRGARQRRMTDRFVQQWTGTVLLAETSADTLADPLFRWKNLVSCLLRGKAVVAVLLLLAVGFYIACRQPLPPAILAYLSTLAFGILVSVAILYKEHFDHRFLDRFCRIGQAVDCNHVLRSPGASLAGAGLGELSLLYFATLFLFCALLPAEGYGVAVACGAVALCFTLYSVGYQLFVLRKGCMLCMLVNLEVWGGSAALVAALPDSTLRCSFATVALWMAVGMLCLIVGLSAKELYAAERERRALQERRGLLLRPEVFQRLLPLGAPMEALPSADAVLQSPFGSGRPLLVVTNPNCGRCAQVHRQLEQLAALHPVRLLLLTFPNDRSGAYAAQTIIAAYQAAGWRRAMELLGEWYRKKRIDEADCYPATLQAKQLWREQQEFCRKQGIDKTPVVIAQGHYVPECYSLDELRYVLT